MISDFRWRTLLRISWMYAWMFFFSASVSADDVVFDFAFPCARASGQQTKSARSARQNVVVLFITDPFTRYLPLIHRCLFPGPYPCPRRIEESFVVPFAQLLTRFIAQQFPKRSVLVVDPQVIVLVGGCYFVRSEEEPVGIAIDQIGGGFC